MINISAYVNRKYHLCKTNGTISGCAISFMALYTASKTGCCCVDSYRIHLGLVGAKLQNATSDFFELDLSKNHSPVKWLP
nr:hypothetical protein SYMBAF_110177 [Serratia symbiotica]